MKNCAWLVIELTIITSPTEIHEKAGVKSCLKDTYATCESWNIVMCGTKDSYNGDIIPSSWIELSAIKLPMESAEQSIVFK